jgi:hypothetical protein
MSKIMSFIKSIRLRQVLTAFLLGAVLLFNTACSGPAQAKMSNSVKTPSGDGGPNPAGQNQPYEGGMNNFTDAAPSGKAVEGTEGRVQQLIDNADAMKAKSPKDYAEKVWDNGRGPERAQEVGDKLKGRFLDDGKDELKATGDRVVGSGERAVEKAQELGDRISKGASDVKDNVVGAGDTVSTSSRRTGEGIKGKAAD